MAKDDGEYQRPEPGRVGYWTQTVDGGRFYPNDPRPGDFAGRPAALAEQLAKVARFGGATPGRFYSVAEHSVHVATVAAELAPEGYKVLARRVGLLHDAHEAYLGDMPRPVKKGVASVAEAWPALEHLSEMAIMRAYGIEPEAVEQVTRWVREADRRVLNAEARALLARPEWCVFPETPDADVNIMALEWRDAATYWECAQRRAWSSRAR